MVARLNGVQEVSGSNPDIPTIEEDIVIWAVSFHMMVEYKKR